MFAEFDGGDWVSRMLNPKPLRPGETVEHEPRPVAGASLRRRDRQDVAELTAMAKIEKVELRMVDLVPKVKRTDAIQSFVSQETPIVTITDADGAVGTGYSYTIGTGGSSVMRLLVRSSGAAPHRPRRRPDRGDLARARIRHACHDDRRDHRDRALRRSTPRCGICGRRSRTCRCGSSPAAPRTAARSTRPKAAGCTSRRKRWSTTRSPPRPRAFAARRSRSASRTARRILRGCRRCARRSATATRS